MLPALLDVCGVCGDGVHRFGLDATRHGEDRSECASEWPPAPLRGANGAKQVACIRPSEETTAVEDAVDTARRVAAKVLDAAELMISSTPSAKTRKTLAHCRSSSSPLNIACCKF